MLKAKATPLAGLAGALAISWLILVGPGSAQAATSLQDAWCTAESACVGVGASDESGDYNVHAKRWNGTAWTAETLTAPEGALTSRLLGVTCASATDCTAVGSWVDEDQARSALVMRWNGSSWSTPSIPMPEEAVSSELAEVACTSASACIAVGSFLDEEEARKALAMRWNGSSWSLSSHPQPSETVNELAGISCVAASDCVAVGSFVNSSGVTKTLASVWNGTSWSVASTPEPSGAELNQLQDVSCRPSEACTAVGNYSDASGEEKTLALRRSAAGVWSIQTTPNQAGVLSRRLTAVSCATSSSCTAVGFFEQGTKEIPIAIGWNGTSWSSQSIDSEALGASSVQPLSVYCFSASACHATGSVSYGRSAAPRNLAFKFNGSAWLVTEQGSYERTWAPFDAMNRKKELSGISCPASQRCFAVGQLVDDQGAMRAQLASFAAGSWGAEAAPAPSGAKSSQLAGVSCTSPSSCWAVGAYVDSEDAQKPLLLEWNGSSWSVQSPPSPGSAEAAVLTAVDCVSAGSCTAVGSYIDAEEVHRPLAMDLDGSSWTLDDVPLPSGVAGAALSAVSCPTATACVAVGIQQDGFGHETGAAASWNGTSWSIVATPSLDDEAPHQLMGISCTSSTQCIAVGSYEGLDSKNHGLALSWDGTDWENAGLPAGDLSPLAAVSCATASACTAVGRDATSSTQPPRIVGWDGTDWETAPPADYAGEVSMFVLAGVSCYSADECNAVGSASFAGKASANASFTFADGEWFMADATAQGAGLRGVSCESAEDCVAVGDSTAPSESSAAAWVLDEETWKVEATTTDAAYLEGIHCLSAADCVAVGRKGAWPFEPIAQRWDGEAWVAQAMPSPAGRSSNLEAVSCATSSWCVSAGFTWPSSGAGPAAPLAETWNGSSWQLATLPLPGGAASAFLFDVSCVSASWCVAVGTYTDSAGTYHGLVERWNGSSWTQSSISPPGGQSYRLRGVDCTSSTACTAVGSSTGHANGELAAIAMRWNGTSWASQTVTLPEGATAGLLNDVDCYSSTSCAAAGRVSDASAHRPLIVAWSAGGWQTEAIARTAAEGTSSLDSISCPSAGDCVAAGTAQTPGRSAEPLLLHTEAEKVEESTDPIEGPNDPSPTLTEEQKDDALDILEEDPAFQAVIGSADYDTKIMPWTHVTEASEESLVGAYVEVTLEEPEEWPEREWSVTNYESEPDGTVLGEYAETYLEAAAAEIELLSVGLDLTFDASENVIEGEAVEVYPLPFNPGSEVIPAEEEFDDTMEGY